MIYFVQSKVFDGSDHTSLLREEVEPGILTLVGEWNIADFEVNRDVIDALHLVVSECFRNLLRLFGSTPTYYPPVKLYTIGGVCRSESIWRNNTQRKEDAVKGGYIDA